MTEEEAITKLKSFCHNCEKFPTCVNTDKECFKALEMAIEAINQVEQIKAILEMWQSDKHTYYVLEEIKKVVNE